MTSSNRRRRFFKLLVLLFTWLLADAVAFVLLGAIGTPAGLFWQPRPADHSDVDRWGARWFDAELGWDIPADDRGPRGERKRASVASPPALASFGDSFTYGTGVSADETWTALLEKPLGGPCLDYGVPGYGPDQALLKHRRVATRARVACLGVLDENVGRVVTSWWGCYHPGQSYRTKPRFRVDDGKLVLVPNPIASRDDLAKVEDPRFLAELERDDYWRARLEEIGAPRRLVWPATLTIAAHAPFFARQASLRIRNAASATAESRFAARKVFHLYDEGSPGLAIIDEVIAAFARDAESRGERPLVLLFPIRDSADVLRRFGAKPNATLIARLEKRGIAFLDLADAFAREPDLAPLYLPDGHFSAKGHELVAARVVEKLSVR